MGKNDIPHDDDWRADWARDRISNLRDELDDSLSEGGHIQYYDDMLDEAHDAAGFYDSDSTGDYDAGFYDHMPSWLARLASNLWWRWRWVIPLTALLIPLLLLVGLIGVLIYLDKDDTPATPAASTPPTPVPVLTAAWPVGVDFAQHTIPAMIRDELAAVGAQRGYQFYGTAGTVWTITVEPDYGSGLDPQFWFYEPDGSELAKNDNRTETDPGAEAVVILPSDGWYRLVIGAADESLTTGVYWLTVME